MRWILLDVALAVLALLALVLVGLSVWRRVKALGAQVTRAGQTLGRAIEAIEQEPEQEQAQERLGGVGSASSTKERLS